MGGRLPRLLTKLLLRYRYEGLSPSGLSVNGVRNDNMGSPSKASAMTVWDGNDKDGRQ